VAAVLVLLGPFGQAVAGMTRRISECSITSRQPWKKQSLDGRFSLSMTVERGKIEGPDVYQLWLRRGPRLVWQLVLRNPITEQMTWIAPDGRYVLLLRQQDELTLMGPSGQERSDWSLRTFLSEAEQARLPRDMCQKPRWLERARFEGGTFVLEVPTGLLGLEELSAEQGLEEGEELENRQRITLRVDLKLAKLERDGERFQQKDAELVTAFEAEQRPERRLWIADELLGRSQLKEHVKGKELQDFWKRLLQARELAPPLLHRMAVEAVSAMGTEGEVRALARLPGEVEVRDVAVLDVLARRFPNDAGEYAVRVLDGRHPGVAVRKRALLYLLARSGPVKAMAQQFALQDEDRELRRLWLHSIDRIDSEKRFETALSFCAQPHAAARHQVTARVLKLLASTAEPSRQGFLELLRGAEKRMELEGCPELVLALGAIAHHSGDKAKALELYSKGVRLVPEQPDPDALIAPDLLMEALLQLAQEEEAKGQYAEAERYARLVLTSPFRSSRVCAPRPSVHANFPGVETCTPQQQAEQVAKAFLGQLKSKARAVSAPSKQRRAR
jgi:hypothetical protein